MIDAIVFLGIQGSGKGTQAKLLAAHTGFEHLNMGDVLREQSRLSTPLGKEVKSIIDGGELVSDELVYKLISTALPADCLGVIFDGFPRTPAQAEHLVKKLPPGQSVLPRDQRSGCHCPAGRPKGVQQVWRKLPYSEQAPRKKGGL
ncbi:MAG: nucleoside monophosphate kinase [Candidatus Cloacimonetes bacterium]|nr:nucleoside monophosphate kinase [Candidatus Cloacimonadota bacterium]